MTDYPRRRPGRPPRVPVDQEPSQSRGVSAEAGEAVPGASPELSDEARPRRRRASVGGLAKKLEAPAREGYVRRWFNDVGNRLAEAEELGYTHVSETGLKTSSPGSRVSRLTGTQANGEPLHSFLMETPEELYAQGVAEKEESARTVDEAISRGDGTLDGQMSQIPADQRYGRGEIRPDR